MPARQNIRLRSVLIYVCRRAPCLATAGTIRQTCGNRCTAAICHDPNRSPRSGFRGGKEQQRGAWSYGHFRPKKTCEVVHDGNLTLLYPTGALHCPTGSEGVPLPSYPLRPPYDRRPLLVCLWQIRYLAPHGHFASRSVSPGCSTLGCLCMGSVFLMCIVRNGARTFEQRARQAFASVYRPQAGALQGSAKHAWDGRGTFCTNTTMHLTPTRNLISRSAWTGRKASRGDRKIEHSYASVAAPKWKLCRAYRRVYAAVIYFFARPLYNRDNNGERRNAACPPAHKLL